MKTRNKLLFNNTYKSGSVTFLIVPEEEKYRGVCLEFDLTVEAGSAREAKMLIEDYAKVWYRNAVVNELPEEVLNRPARKKYWKIYKGLIKQDLRKLEAEGHGSVENALEPTHVGILQAPYPGLAFA